MSEAERRKRDVFAVVSIALTSALALVRVATLMAMPLGMGLRLALVVGALACTTAVVWIIWRGRYAPLRQILSRAVVPETIFGVLAFVVVDGPAINGLVPQMLVSYIKPTCGDSSVCEAFEYTMAGTVLQINARRAVAAEILSVSPAPGVVSNAHPLADPCTLRSRVDWATIDAHHLHDLRTMALQALAACDRSGAALSPPVAAAFPVAANR